ncbi:Asp-tRNA(Asn)/Glu-tRNA(Gln) amidotransferase subunit GatC [Methanohalophilus profundi]|uniref:Asp-tRNA(Asn)/Glu-tRNA(Gln) amidotransferase subunit GatC n=1 Tax=Methanohalophilus profundi TaxID=2138083 RepID=UPI00101B7F5C|nr:Asp-tRNA(Asn)/Glu-tRNA(Gln) amidotransferase subunit GatC [Methanohalophilus profundi]
MITKEQVEHIGWLARVNIDEEDAFEFASELSTVLDYFGQLDGVDTSDVKPTYHVADVMNVFREDEPTGSLEQDSILANAEEIQDGYIRTPKII